ncbi:MAG: hypothetical protein Q9174_003103 [Haloplaca sp. 1 TL-2023]
MGKKRKQLSHEEVWDDSALIDSWDAALQEYQLYHSIHARGERVEDVLKEAEATEDSTRPKDDMAVDSIGDPAEELEDGEVEEELIEDDALVKAGAEAQVVFALYLKSGSTAVPEVLIKSMQDDALKNLMMSWYYAGYYTGLFEGQQQASATASAAAVQNGEIHP